MKRLALTISLFATAVFAQAAPTAETVPIATPTGAKDTAIWVHPTQPALSLVFGTDQFGASGLFAYGLNGAQRQQLLIGNTVGVDVRYGVPVDNFTTDVLLAAKSDGTFLLYSVDAVSGILAPIDVGPAATGSTINAAALYFSPRTRVLMVLIADTTGKLRMYRATGNGAGKLTTQLVRTHTFDAPVQGLVADDRGERVFLTLENKGLFVLQAEVAGTPAPLVVDSIDAGRIAGASGVALYFTADAGGYVLVSSSANSRFPVYSLGAGFPFVTAFNVVASDAGISGAINTRGIEVTQRPLGASFPQGLFVAHDEGRTNYKLVRWEDIARVPTVPLAVDPRVDPRTWTSAIDAGADAGRTDAGPPCVVPTPDGGDAGPSDGGDAGACVGGTGGGSGGGSGGFGAGLGGGVPPVGGGGGEGLDSNGCHCSQPGLLFPLAALVWLWRRRRNDLQG